MELRWSLFDIGIEYPKSDISAYYLQLKHRLFLFINLHFLAYYLNLSVMLVIDRYAELEL